MINAAYRMAGVSWMEKGRRPLMESDPALGPELNRLQSPVFSDVTFSTDSTISIISDVMSAS
jgi:hypothetical protein